MVSPHSTDASQRSRSSASLQILLPRDQALGSFYVPPQSPYSSLRKSSFTSSSSTDALTCGLHRLSFSDTSVYNSYYSSSASQDSVGGTTPSGSAYQQQHQHRLQPQHNLALQQNAWDSNRAQQALLQQSNSNSFYDLPITTYPQRDIVDVRSDRIGQSELLEQSIHSLLSDSHDSFGDFVVSLPTQP